LVIWGADKRGMVSVGEMRSW